MRESKLADRLAPITVSFERHITEYERKLDTADLETVKRLDPTPTMKYFLLFSRLERFSQKHQAKLEKLNFHVFRLLPFA